MRVEIKRLQRSLGTTSVYVTHDQMEAMTMADRLVVLNAGNIEQVGTPIELYEKPASTFVATFIGSPSMNLLESGEKNLWQPGKAVTLPSTNTRSAYALRTFASSRTVNRKPTDSMQKFASKPSNSLVLKAISIVHSLTASH